MANERDTAVRFVHDILEQCEGWREVLFLAVFDNVCQDGTVDLLRQYSETEKRLKVIWAPQNRCVVDAYVEGYRQALATGFEWILEIDAGYSHQPSDFKKFAEALGPDVDCLFGSRFCSGGKFEGAPLKRYAVSRGGSLLSNLLLGTRLSDMTSGYQMFTREALQFVLDEGIESRGHFFQTEMKFRCRRHRCVEIPIRYRSPSNSLTGASLGDALRGLVRLFNDRFRPRKH